MKFLKNYLIEIFLIFLIINMECYENEDCINFQLKGSKYYENHKILEEMGFNSLLIKKIYAFINPKNLNDAITFMTTNQNNIHQHFFFPNKDNNKCFYCEDEEKNHINYVLPKIMEKENIIENKQNNDSNLKDNNDQKEYSYNEDKKEFKKEIILEAELGDKIEIDENIYKKLEEKGKKTTCKIISKSQDENVLNGTGFFCKIPYLNKTIKVLLTNYHILNYKLIEKGNIIKLSYQSLIKIIEITDERNYWVNELYDFTCIEILNKDDIEDFYEIENFDNVNDSDEIIIVQYPKGGPIKINKGQLISINNNEIYHNVETHHGSSGSPIILLNQSKVIGIHRGYSKEFTLNLGINIKNVIDYINRNEIIYNLNIKNKDNLGNEIQILNYVEEGNFLFKLLYDNNFEKCFDIYLNEEKIQFCWKYKFQKEGKNKIKIKSNQLLCNMNHMFSECNYITYIDLSNFNTINVFNMSYLFNKCNSLINLDLSNMNTINVKDMEGMFYQCYLLESLNLSNFNTINVKNMINMFYECNSLKYLDLSNFDTSNVKDMSYMFFKCSSLISLDLSKFNTNNVTNISYMFSGCVSLKSLNLLYFKTNNVKNMKLLFNECSSLSSLNLSNFNTNNVNDMYGMFYNCSSLTSLNLSNFNTNYIKDMSYMFFKCSSLKILDISNFDTHYANFDNLFNEINEKCLINCKDKKILDKYKNILIFNKL